MCQILSHCIPCTYVVYCIRVIFQQNFFFNSCLWPPTCGRSHHFPPDLLQQPDPFFTVSSCLFSALQPEWLFKNVNLFVLLHCSKSFKNFSKNKDRKTYSCSCLSCSLFSIVFPFFKPLCAFCSWNLPKLFLSQGLCTCQCLLPGTLPFSRWAPNLPLVSVLMVSLLSILLQCTDQVRSWK